MEYSKGLYNVISIAHRIYQPFKWIRVWTLTQHPRNLGPLDISLPSLSSLTLEKSIIPSYPLPLPRNSNHTRVNNFEHYPSNPSNSMANGTRPTFRCLTSPTFFFTSSIFQPFNHRVIHRSFHSVSKDKDSPCIANLHKRSIRYNDSSQEGIRNYDTISRYI